MATLSDLTKKLNHPLEEVRQRSARSLRSKLDAGFFALHDLALEPSLPLNLVHMLGLPAEGGKMDAVALVARLAADASASKQLAKLGAVGSLQRLQADPAVADLHAAAASAEHELVRQHGAPMLRADAEETTPELPSAPPPPCRPPRLLSSYIFEGRISKSEKLCTKRFTNGSDAVGLYMVFSSVSKNPFCIYPQNRLLYEWIFPP